MRSSDLDREALPLVGPLGIVLDIVKSLGPLVYHQSDGVRHS